MYGAGSIGRGFIGPLFSNCGYEVAFIDVNRKIIDALNAYGKYQYTVAADPVYDVLVKNVRGVDGADEAAVIEEIAGCDMIATSLGASVLKKVAPTIAKGFSLRMRKNGRPLNLLICENLKDSAHLLRGWIEDAMPSADKPLVHEHAGKLGLIEAAVGRMVPVAVQNDDDPLHLTVEAYGFLPVDKAAFVEEPPAVKGLVPHTPFAFYEERKLYLHNMGHAICAYFGERNGAKTIAEAISLLSVRLFVQGAMTEAAAMLSIKYSVPFTRIFDHAEDLLLRFENAYLHDTCARVGRDPMRKLKAGDRLAGALSECFRHQVYPVYIALGFAVTLRTLTDDVNEAASLARNTGGLTEEQTALVMKLFEAADLPDGELFQKAERIKRELRGNIV